MTLSTPCIGCGTLVPVGTGGRCGRCRAPARRLRSGRVWRDLAATVRSIGRCAECGRVGPVEAGHVIPATHRLDLALDPANVRPLCAKCNVRGPRQ